MDRFKIEATKHLPDHELVLQAMLDFFYRVPGVIGCFLSGSMATGEMDEDSDLDLGIVFDGTEKRNSIWRKRWKWEIADWFHRFDADHIKPYFVIYLYEPQIKADINLYLKDDLPSVEGGPYAIVWDHQGVLDIWIKNQPEPVPSNPNWDAVVHEDERFWAWAFYVYGHIHRGEYYHIADEFKALRNIVEQWSARLGGHTNFGTRHLENQGYAKRLFDYDLFPKPEIESLKVSMLDLIDLQIILREEIKRKIGIHWKTNDKAIRKITMLIRGL
jgi:predicted nucleotidyltransferase